MVTEFKGLASNLNVANLQIQKTNGKIETFRNEYVTGLEITKSDFRDRLNDIDKYYSETIEEITMNVEKIRVMARDTVNTKQKELSGVVNKQAR